MFDESTLSSYKISVVVPIYNGTKYINKMYQCLSSQTHCNFEVFCVDDMSTDSSYDLLNELTQNDARFHVIKRETKGGTAAKGQEFAIPMCTGDYYFFMSQDDFFDSNLFEECLRRALEENAEVVLPNMILYGSKNNDSGSKNNYIETTLTGREAFLKSIRWEIHGFSLRSMDLVRRVGFDAKYYNSCEYYLRKSYLYANKIVFCNSNFYYRQDNTEAITKSNKYFLIDILQTDLLLYRLLRKHKYSYEVRKKRLQEINFSRRSWIARSKDYANRHQRNYIYKVIINVFVQIYFERIVLLYQKYMSNLK